MIMVLSDPEAHNSVEADSNVDIEGGRCDDP